MAPAALAEAIDVRNRYGLRVDEAWIRQVAGDPAAQIGVNEFGIPLTPAEFADLMSRHWDPNLHAAIVQYGNRYPDDFSGSYINQKASGVVAAFANHLDKHRHAVAKLVVDPTLVEFRAVEWSLTDLDRLVREVRAETAWFESAGLRIQNVSPDILRNRVRVDYIGPAPDFDRVITDHFRNADWLNPQWYGPPPWHGPRGDLTVTIVDLAGRPVANVECVFVPEDPLAVAEFMGDQLHGSGPDGRCKLSNVPAVGYRVTLHRLIGSDRYEEIPAAEFRVTVRVAGVTVPVVIP